MARNILVIGGGPAGVMAAIAAKRQDAAAAVTLLTDEGCEPYEKPPLSKAVLTGKAAPEDALIAGKGGLAAHDVHVEHHARVASIDREGHAVVTASGARLPYDALVLATGSVVREIPALPLGTPRVHYLRTETESRALKAELAGARNVVVIGGGLIGLEVAASARELGLPVAVLEMMPRILARVCDEETGAFIHAEHRRRGVDIRVGTSAKKITAAGGRVEIETSAGDVLTPDVVIVGTGVRPSDELASAAGLETKDGIIVDAHCRTSDPAIYAAGDVVRFPGPHGPVRLENWRHAQDQGTVAGRNAAGANEAYTTAPSFWSEQFDLYIQGVGWEPPTRGKRVHRPLGDKAMLMLETDGAHLVYALGINAQRDLAAVRRLIERRVAVDPDELADPAKPFAAMLKARA